MSQADDALPPRVRWLLSVLEGLGGSGAEQSLLAAMAQDRPGVRPAVAAKVVEVALSLGVLSRDHNGRLSRLGDPDPADDPPAIVRHGSRQVALDLETLVRAAVDSPYVERAIRQVGAFRCGTDEAWVGQMPGPLAMDVATPDRFGDTRTGRPIGEALDAIEDICRGAETLITYNGSELDVPVLESAFEEAGRTFPQFRHADMLPITHALWPLASSHRLQDICPVAGVAPRQWHNALEDATATAELIEACANRLRALGDVAPLIASVGQSSPAWRLVIEAAGLKASQPMSAAAAAALLEGHVHRALLRDPTQAAAAHPVTLPSAWKRDGTTDAHLLAVAVRPDATARAGQAQMQTAVEEAVAAGQHLLVEAPTGTGKSFVILAAALDWIARDPQNAALIATHTKQLQGQLAGDVERLAALHAPIGEIATVAKGSANRLSLRALTVELADLTRSRTRTARDPRRGSAAYGELLAFLALRFLDDPNGLQQSWEIHSVDTADIPPCFEVRSSGRYRGWLADLSQSAADELGVDDALGGHTRSTREHLDSARLVVANHALVFAHLEHLLGKGERLLVLFDEAHTLESSATQAFTSRFESPAVEVAIRRARVASRRLGEPFTTIAEQLDELLDEEVLHNTAMRSMDVLTGRPDPGASTYPRTSALASPYGGAHRPGDVRRFVVELARLARRLSGSKRRVAQYCGAEFDKLESAERVLVFDLLARLGSLADATRTVVADIDLVWGTDILAARTRPGRLPGRKTPAPTAGDLLEADAEPVERNSNPTGGGHDGAVEQETQDVDDDVDSTAVDDPGSDPDGLKLELEAVAEPGDYTAAPSNRLVSILELSGSDLSEGRRGYRFAVESAPIHLPAASEWAGFLTGFARMVLASATLTVSGDWTYVSDRLGIKGGEWRKTVVDGAFDWKRQARLFVLEDFPSWSEQPEGAARTAAHQLAGYASAVSSAGKTPAGLLLTTSTAAASSIAERMLARLAVTGQRVDVWPAPVWGNRGVIERQLEHGGVVTGTKGLWAGVDIADPERVRVVWINKIPFAPFADPLIATRRAEVQARAERAGHPDPEAHASEQYYLPIAALDLRQGVGRLIRSERHGGVVIISDRRLAGGSTIRRTWRRILLGSLDPGLQVAGPDGESWAGNVVPMTQAWTEAWRHLASVGHLPDAALPPLLEREALEQQVWPPETLAVRAARLSPAEAGALRTAGTYSGEVVRRATDVARNLRFDSGLDLHETQQAAIEAAAKGCDVLGLLATGFGKSFCYQLPALIEPGVTLVISPLVALMTDQALDLNKVAGGAVRALVAPMRESVSRAGRQELAEQLEGTADHGIKLVYVSPERLAQRTVRTWIENGVRGGHVQRIVFDEAHTLVQWGEDFRPSYRRLAVFLSGLHAIHPTGRLPISAFTATANRTVRSGLEETLFAGRRITSDLGAADAGDVLLLAGEPIRPELAIYRRAFKNSGTITRARLLESLVDTLSNHAIIYATTVRDVDATWAHLRGYLGEADAVRVRRFHGRLPEAEKSDVLEAFKQAPSKQDAIAAGEQFRPLIIVATSAFGLGVDRRDVRTVISLTPPTDLAALYQQLGRAGRDARGTVPTSLDDANVTIALADTRGMRTVEFLTRDHQLNVLNDAARQVLRCGGILDPSTVADRLIAQQVRSGQLSLEESLKAVTIDSFRSAVVRVMALLAAAGAVDDLGDFPASVRLRTGEDPPRDPIEHALAAYVVDGPVVVDLADLHHALTEDPGVEISPDPAQLWTDLVDLHHRGVLDVSCASARWRTSLQINSRKLPDDWDAQTQRRTRRAQGELGQLTAWYTDSACANLGFARYFSLGPAPTVPASCCSAATNRCSTCGPQHPGPAPTLMQALMNPAPKRNGPAVNDDRLDRAVTTLLLAAGSGLGVSRLRMILRGEDTYYDTRLQRRRPLQSRLLHHRLFGSWPGLRETAITDSLSRLTDNGIATMTADERPRWRHMKWVRLDHEEAAAAEKLATKP